MRKFLPLALLGTLMLGACNTTSGEKPPLQLPPAQDEAFQKLVATKIEGSVDSGVALGFPFKTASISKPYAHTLPFKDKPSVSYCVFFELDTLLGQPTSAMADINEHEGGNPTVLVTIRRGLTAKSFCGDMEMRPFPKLIELRKQRQERREREPAPFASTN